MAHSHLRPTRLTREDFGLGAPPRRFCDGKLLQQVYQDSALDFAIRYISLSRCRSFESESVWITAVTAQSAIGAECVRTD